MTRSIPAATAAASTCFEPSTFRSQARSGSVSWRSHAAWTRHVTPRNVSASGGRARSKYRATPGFISSSTPRRYSTTSRSAARRWATRVLPRYPEEPVTPTRGLLRSVTVVFRYGAGDAVRVGHDREREGCRRHRGEDRRVGEVDITPRVEATHEVGLFTLFWRSRVGEASSKVVTLRRRGQGNLGQHGQDTKRRGHHYKPSGNGAKFASRLGPVGR